MLFFMSSDLGDLPSLVRTITERYNFLATLSDNIAKEVRKRDVDVGRFDDDITMDFERLRMLLENLNEMIKGVEEESKDVASEFKYVVKKDAFERLDRRVNNLPYEKLVTRREIGL